MRCPTCKGRFSLLKFLGKKGNLYRVLVHCKDCGTYGIGTARIGDGPVCSPQVETPTSLPITADDVLDMHEFLERFDGNFAALFAG